MDIRKIRLVNGSGRVLDEFDHKPAPNIPIFGVVENRGVREVSKRNEIESTVMRNKYVLDRILHILTDYNGGPENPKTIQIMVKFGPEFITISDKEL